MSSALTLLKTLDNPLAKLLASKTETDVFDRAIAGLLNRYDDKLGLCWALCKALDEADIQLKAEVDSLSRLRRHLAATKEMLRGVATTHLEDLEKSGQSASVKRPDFSASLQETISVSGPDNPEEWPMLFQVRKIVVSANRLAAQARMKSGEAFAGLQLVKTRSVRFL